MATRRVPSQMAKQNLMLLATLSVGLLLIHGHTQSTKQKRSQWKPEISAMGAYARGDIPMPGPRTREGVPREAVLGDVAPSLITGLQGDDIRVNSTTGVDYQTETTIAVSGNAVVFGYNDWRGFTNLGSQYPDFSLSGYAYSSDGGVSWTDGGQLPLLTGLDQVYGDPDIKTWTDTQGSGTTYFFYSSIYKNPVGDFSLSVHVSSDGGMTWSTPREITTAKSATDFSDKLFMDVDPETGRILISWTNFGASVTMRTTYSDDLGLTWNGPWVFASVGQGSVPRADPTSNFAYITWLSSGKIVFAKSIDNGASWGSMVSLVSGLVEPMNPYGSDRINGFPSMAVSPTTGFIYIVYAARQIPPDFSDIYFMFSNDNGATFSTPQLISSAPGDDRAQFFPWVTVDNDGETVSVIWLDQILGLGTSDLTDVFHTHTINNGSTWTCPAPITDFSFHAEHGNTTSQPNIGDYVQAVSVGGTLYSAFPRTTGMPAHFNGIDPDAYFEKHAIFVADAAPISLDDLTVVDVGCVSGNSFWEPGETIDITATIRDYSLCSQLIGNITGTLTTTHSDVTVVSGNQSFGILNGQNDTTTHGAPFTILLDPNIACGDRMDFLLTISSDGGSARLLFWRRVGHPVSTVLLSEDFDGVTAPALPAGWTTSNPNGTPNPWVTSTTYAQSGSNSAFCANISSTSLNRLHSPSVNVPPVSDLVEVLVDVTHDIEIDFERKAWDGALMWIEINGFERLAGFFAEEFEPFYPWQMNRQSSIAQPRQDLACWSSDVTPNFTQVRMTYPGIGLQNVGVIFDMSSNNAIGTATGMFVDNVTISTIEYVCDCPDPAALVAMPGSVLFENTEVGVTTCDTICIVNEGEADLIISDIRGCDTEPFSIETRGTAILLASGDTTMMVVCVTPTDVGPDSCTITVTSNDPNSPANILVTTDVITRVGETRLLSFGNLQVFPNPFNPSTTIRFTLPNRMPVTTEVWNVAGERVRVLTDQRVFGAGLNEIEWRGLNDRGNEVGSGIYFIRIRTELGDRTVRAVLLK